MAIQILRAVTQHVNYLGMVRRCLVDGVENSRCCDHHSCLFGKWYDTDGTAMIEELQLFKATELWSEIGMHHEHFHAESMAVVEMAGTDLERARKMETGMMQRSAIMVNRLLELDALVSAKGL
jgi:hypothetical protein